MQLRSAYPHRSALLRQCGGFLAAGGAGFVIDAVLTVVFVQAGGLSPFLARIPAVSIAIVCTWIMNRHWTFRSADPDRLAEFLRYGWVSLCTAGVNYLVYCAALALAPLAGFSVSDAPAIVLATVCGS
ncbi:MAG: GtrA family protein, partial [Beijerinckiaceae bacterium]